MVWITWHWLGGDWLGADSHAYWNAWQADWHRNMYDIEPNRIDAYNYSPAFAQVIWPLAHLSWPAFGVLWSVGSALAFAYLLWPMGRRWSIPLFLCVLPEVLVGNIYAYLAVAAVWGLAPGRPGRGGWWSVIVLTKVTPALGPVWFAARREWRRLAWSIAVTLAVIAISWTITPDLWHQWLDFLGDNEASSERVGASELPPLVFRLPLALIVVTWGALTDRRWSVPVAMVLATPVASVTSLAMLAAIPRLKLQDAEDLA